MKTATTFVAQVELGRIRFQGSDDFIVNSPRLHIAVTMFCLNLVIRNN
jgi:hypothetical protein